MSLFYLKGVEEEFGPYTYEELKSKSIVEETLVRKENEDNWQNAEKLEELNGLLEVSMQTTQKPPHWDKKFKADHCSGNGYRQYSSILWDIPWGQSWEETCARTPATINGYYFPYPNRVKKNTHIWGEFDVPSTQCRQAGSLHSNCLFILHGPKTITNASSIQNKTNMFKNYVSQFSFNQVNLRMDFVNLSSSFRIGKDFEADNDMPDFHQSSLITNLRNTLASQGVNLSNYHSYYFIYDQNIEGHSAHTSAGLTWAWNRATAIHYPTGDKIEEVILHEFLHHLDYHFQQKGEPDFIDCDCKEGKFSNCKRSYVNENRFRGSNLDFYCGVMRFLDHGGFLNYSPVDYRKLHGALGSWG